MLLRGANTKIELCFCCGEVAKAQLARKTGGSHCTVTANTILSPSQKCYSDVCASIKAKAGDMSPREELAECLCAPVVHGIAESTNP